MSRRSHHGRGHGRPRPHKSDQQRSGSSPNGPPRSVASARPADPPQPAPRPTGVEPPLTAQSSTSNHPPTAPSSAPNPSSTPVAEPQLTPARIETEVIGPAVVESTGAGNGSPVGNGGERPTCTAPQLRRFIKSRPWIPLHELRRRFAINGAEDEVTPVHLDGRTVFVGLPAHEGALLGELLRGGEIGYELSLDPGAPIVIGVYPMRPVPRP
jgi:hypothetical protein